MLVDGILRVVRERGLLSPAVFDALREHLASRGAVDAGSLLEALHARTLPGREAVLPAVAEALGLEWISAEDLVPSAEAGEAVPGEWCAQWQLLPLERVGQRLRVAVSDPFDLEGVDQLSHLSGFTVEAVLADATALREAIDRHRRNASADSRPVAVAAVSTEEAPVVAAGPEAEAAGSIEGYVQRLIDFAVARRASDIHLEPMERRLRVRLRIDGRLREVESPSRHLQAAIISRVKLTAGLSIAEKRLPQDGRFRTKVDGRELDLRVSCLPSVFGETVVMRILDPSSLVKDLSELGCSAADERSIRRLIGSPDGIFLVTGPTGSGKSTTLYALLQSLNEPGRKLITVEDPVEYQIAGINQVPVRREIGMGFASALRAMLRQAPNIIMIGEIRDRETAEIAINASFTGHLVFSTLHTNDAPSAITRLVDIGVQPFLLAGSLRAVLAQRLVRRLCQDCRGDGCARCDGVGCRGRIGLFELLEINDDLAGLIHRKAALAEIRRAARAGGMQTMRQDGEEKAAASLTLLEEVLAATSGDPL